MNQKIAFIWFEFSKFIFEKPLFCSGRLVGYSATLRESAPFVAMWNMLQYRLQDNQDRLAGQTLYFIKIIRRHADYFSWIARANYATYEFHFIFSCAVLHCCTHFWSLLAIYDLMTTICCIKSAVVRFCTICLLQATNLYVSKLHIIITCLTK